MARSILLVEANDNLSILWAYNLECEGYRVHLAADGEEALEALALETPDLILIDSLQPPASATELCRRIRLRPESRHVPILLIADSAHAAVLAEGYAGADACLPMPFAVETLRERVRALLAQAPPAAAPRLRG